MAERAAPTLQLTDRDVEILAWLARFRGATADQVARRFAMGYSRVSRRLNQLGNGGLVTLTRVLHRRPGMYLVTARGLTSADVDLPVAELGAYEHDLAVVTAAIDAELAGERVVTQRQMHTLEAPPGSVAAAQLLYALELHGERHYPDLVLERDDGRWAVEVELSDVRSDLLEAVLGAYAAAEHLAGVIYRVAPSVRAERIQRIGDALDLSDRLQLDELSTPEE